MWKNLHDDRDRGKIKEQKYPENAMKNKLSVRANLSRSSLKKTFEKCRQTKYQLTILCVQGHHQIIPYKTCFFPLSLSSQHILYDCSFNKLQSDTAIKIFIPAR